MDTCTACSYIGGFSDDEPTEEQVVEAWQFLIDTGVVWQMQGFYGRGATELITRGVCTPAKPNGGG